MINIERVKAMGLRNCSGGNIDLILRLCNVFTQNKEE